MCIQQAKQERVTRRCRPKTRHRCLGATGFLYFLVSGWRAICLIAPKNQEKKCRSVICDTFSFIFLNSSEIIPITFPRQKNGSRYISIIDRLNTCKFFNNCLLLTVVSLPLIFHSNFFLLDLLLASDL